LTESDIHRLAALHERMLESLQSVDRSVAAIVKAVAARGGLRNTVIAYTSDNGFLLGQHRLVGKIWPYEESIRVPLVVRAPWVPAPGRTDDHMVLNIDLASTLADLAGVEPGLPQDGISLVPLLRSGMDPPGWRSDFVVEFLGHERGSGSPPRYEGLRTKRYLFLRYFDGARELYDLRRDPYELDNLARDPASRSLRRRLEERLRVSLEG
jgi:arylsulfatase A-like enzyme